MATRLGTEYLVGDSPLPIERQQRHLNASFHIHPAAVCLLLGSHEWMRVGPRKASEPALRRRPGSCMVRHSTLAAAYVPAEENRSVTLTSLSPCLVFSIEICTGFWKPGRNPICPPTPNLPCGSTTRHRHPVTQVAFYLSGDQFQTPKVRLPRCQAAAASPSAAPSLSRRCLIHRPVDPRG